MELVEYCYIKKVSARVMRLRTSMMAISAGLECRFVSVQQMEVVMHGIRLRLTESGIILIVQDDPVGGGYENYKYYLSESLWADHIAETEKIWRRDEI